MRAEALPTVRIPHILLFVKWTMDILILGLLAVAFALSITAIILSIKNMKK